MRASVAIETRYIRILLKIEKKGKARFSPLQGNSLYEFLDSLERKKIYKFANLTIRWEKLLVQDSISK